jgi:hypothetical protein
MRPVRIGPVPASDKEKLAWCVQAIQDIALASQVADPNVIADSFVVSNVTETRTVNADTVTLPQLANVVCTFLQDLKRRGQKGTGV